MKHLTMYADYERSDIAIWLAKQIMKHLTTYADYERSDIAIWLAKQIMTHQAALVESTECFRPLQFLDCVLNWTLDQKLFDLYTEKEARLL